MHSESESFAHSPALHRRALRVLASAYGLEGKHLTSGQAAPLIAAATGGVRRIFDLLIDEVREWNQLNQEGLCVMRRTLS